MVAFRVINDVTLVVGSDLPSKHITFGQRFVLFFYMLCCGVTLPPRYDNVKVNLSDPKNIQ